HLRPQTLLCAVSKNRLSILTDRRSPNCDFAVRSPDDIRAVCRLEIRGLPVCACAGKMQARAAKAAPRVSQLSARSTSNAKMCSALLLGEPPSVLPFPSHRFVRAVAIQAATILRPWSETKRAGAVSHQR